MIDFHTHIMPAFDDGAKDIETSLKMVDDAKLGGVDTIICTSHFYPRTEDRFVQYLKKREKSYNNLISALPSDSPKILLGCEVNLHSDFTHFQNIKELCIENTDYMMIELPGGKWDEGVSDILYNLTLHGIKIIFAHIDRYLYHSEREFETILECNPLFQVNADAMLSFFKRRKIEGLFEKNRIHIMGSDMHNTTNRKFNLNSAYDIMKEKFGQRFCNYIDRNGDKILGNESISHFHKIHD